MAIIVDLDVMLAKRKMSVGELSEAIDISPSNIAVLKNGGARPVRYSALETICEVLDCQLGDILRCAAEDGG